MGENMKEPIDLSRIQTQTLEEFIKNETDRLQKFRDWYLEMSRENPNQNWPLDQGSAEWMEQLLIFEPDHD